VSRSAPRSILFVCHGNINRSAYAEAFFRHACDVEVRAASAGFVGPGRASPAVALEVARARGVSLEAHRSRLVDRALVLSSELVVVMDRRQARELRIRYGVRAERIVLLGDLDPETPGRRLVQDPVDRPAAECETIFRRIERCVSELIGCLPR
jgi:protein-tyrosine phosphatase